MRGKFLLIDGLDGVGKDVFLDAMRAEAERQGRRLFDLKAFWKGHGKHPSFAEIKGADILLSAEPTYVGEGKLIREKLIRNGSESSAREIAEAYAKDREELYDQVLIPSLQAGIHVLQVRGVTTSLVYQPLDAERKGERLTLAEVERLRGNAQALKRTWVPDLVVIPVVAEAAEALRRLAAREKRDDVAFERLAFQREAKERFESDWFRELFEGLGATVVYADAQASVEQSRSEAARLYRQLFG